MADVPALLLFCRGIVKLARRWPRGEVANKARIPLAWLPVAWLPVVRGPRTGTIFTGTI